MGFYRLRVWCGVVSGAVLLHCLCDAVAPQAWAAVMAGWCKSALFENSCKCWAGAVVCIQPMYCHHFLCMHACMHALGAKCDAERCMASCSGYSCRICVSDSHGAMAAAIKQLAARTGMLPGRLERWLHAAGGRIPGDAAALSVCIPCEAALCCAAA